MTNSATIPIPYEGDQPLELDPVSEGVSTDRTLSTLVGNSMDDEVIFRILKSAVILKQANPTRSMGDCLDTALIWEFG